jgi:hypothetical protein
MASGSVKLSESIRNRILKKLIGDRFRKGLAEIEAGKLSLGDQVYNRKYDEKEQAVMNGLPHHYLRRVKKVKVRVNGSDVSFELAKPRPVPAEHFHYADESNHLLVLEGKDPIAQEYGRLTRLKADIDADKDKLTREINGVLYSVTMSGKLITVWPEIRKVVEEVCGATDTASLPVVRVAELNQALGLHKAS